jgi:membrane-associated protease RseP (regulator of RpoE activity)
MKPKPSIILAALLAAEAIFGGLSTVYGQRYEFFRQFQDRRGPWLGVYVQDVTGDLAEKKNLKGDEGAYVTEVMEKSPADSAGIQKGDVITEFNGRRIYDADDLVRAVRKAEVGKKAKVVVMRKGENKELSVTLKKYPRKSFASRFLPRGLPHRFMIFGGPGTLGLTLMELNPQLGRYFEAPEGRGVLVESVEEGSAAAKAGFKAGDVILKVGTREVDDIRDIHKELSRHEEGEQISFEILRKGSRITLTVPIEESEGSMGFDYFLGSWEPSEDVDIDLMLPFNEDVFELGLPRFNHYMRDLQIDLERMKRTLEENKRRVERELRENFGKVMVSAEV